MEKLISEIIALKHQIELYQISTKLDYEKIKNLEEEIKKLNIKELKIEKLKN